MLYFDAFTKSTFSTCVFSNLGAKSEKVEVAKRNFYCDILAQWNDTKCFPNIYTIFKT